MTTITPHSAKGKTTKRLVSLARVSTKDQADNGTSLASQTEANVAYSERISAVCVDTLTEDVSGTVPMLERKSGRKADTMLRSGQADGVVFYTADRFGRDLIPALIAAHTWLNAGYEVHFADTGRLESADDIIFLLKSWQGGQERKAIRERTMRGRNSKAKAGKIIFSWRCPYGYKREGDALVINESEAEIVRKIFDWYVNGNYGAMMTNAAIRRKLAEMRVATPAQDTSRKRKRAPFSWNERTLRMLLSRETYVGVWRYGQRIGKNGQGGKRDMADTITVSVPAIVGREIFDAAQERLHEMERTASGRRANKHEYLLRGMVHCGKCKAMMSADRSARRITYRCSRRQHRIQSVDGKCTQRQVTVHILEDIVWDTVLSIVADPAKFQAHCIAAIEAERDGHAPKLTRLEEIARHLARCDSEAAQVSRAMVGQGGIVAKHLQAQADAINAEYESLANEQTKLQTELADGTLAEDDVKELAAFMRDASEGLQDADFELKRTTLEMLYTSVTLNDDEATIEVTISDKHKERRVIAGFTSEYSTSRAYHPPASQCRAPPYPQNRGAASPGSRQG